MAFLREYELNEKMGDILSAIQKEKIGEDEYYAEGKYETWEGVEELADRYGLCELADEPYLVDLEYMELPREAIEEMLFDPELSEYIEIVRERELPAAIPGRMYHVGGGAKSFSEVNWHERVASFVDHCRHCTGTEDPYDGHFFPLVVEEDDGTTSTHWSWCNCIWEGMGDDYPEVERWNDAGEPIGEKGECEYFDWS